MSYRPCELWLRINGNGHAFLREVGCECKRCRPEGPFDDDTMPRHPKTLDVFEGLLNPRCRAATSASLLLARDGCVSKHILVDVGPGVCNSLVDAELPPPDCLLLTHWHPDHLLDINRLVESRKRRWDDAREQGKRSGACPRLPVYCTAETWQVVEQRHDFEAKHRLEYRRASPEFPLWIEELGPDPRHVPAIVPIGVDHGKAEGCVIYWVEWHDLCLLLAWDMLQPPFFWKPPKPLSLLIMEANTWTPQPRTGHVSLTEGLDIVEKWQPTCALFTHISGHEDRDPDTHEPIEGHGWTDKVWTDKIRGKAQSTDDTGAPRYPEIVEKSVELAVALQGRLIRVG